jgi:hypothetical protein
VASSNSPTAVGPSPALSTSPHLSAGLPPSPARSPLELPGRRRQNVVQPPALTTSLNGSQHHGFGGVGVAGGYTSTPTTSLSSPFSQSGYLPSPGAAGRGSSPMAMRGSSYSAPYNPQEWGPVGDGRSPQLGQVSYEQSNNGISLMQPPPPPRPSGL